MERFKQRILKRCVVNERTGCWEWTAAKNKFGYGLLGFETDDARVGVTVTVAHRLSYQAFKGSIPTGQVVRHKCHNPACVNPDHLETGTQADNIKDMMDAGRHRSTPSRGEKNGNAKITTAQVDEIRSLYVRQNRNVPRTGPTLKDLAARYGLGVTQVSRIVKGESW